MANDDGDGYIIVDEANGIDLAEATLESGETVPDFTDATGSEDTSTVSASRFLTSMTAILSLIGLVMFA